MKKGERVQDADPLTESEEVLEEVLALGVRRVLGLVLLSEPLLLLKMLSSYA